MMLVYKATNRINGKCYIGQTRGTLEARIRAHLREATDNPLKGYYFQWALREHGPENFDWEVLCTCQSQEELDAKEQEFISAYDASNPDCGYNIVPGGSGDREDGKLRSLIVGWPTETVLTQRRLDELGIYRQLINKYAAHGWVRKLGAGAYARAGDELSWRGGLHALQTQLGMTVHVGAETALGLSGFGQYVPLGTRQRVVLVSDRPERLPTWFRQYRWGVDLVHHSLMLFESVPEDATVPLDCGGFRVVMSSAERAIMEELRLARTNSELEHALELMRGLTMLRPSVVQSLLERCRTVKVKRLFLWAADAMGHAWAERLDRSGIDLGTGKQQIYKGGSYVPEYRITVPPQEELPGV